MVLPWGLSISLPRKIHICQRWQCQKVNGIIFLSLCCRLTFSFTFSCFKGFFYRQLSNLNTNHCSEKKLSFKGFQLNCLWSHVILLTFWIIESANLSSLSEIKNWALWQGWMRILWLNSIKSKIAIYHFKAYSHWEIGKVKAKFSFTSFLFSVSLSLTLRAQCEQISCDKSAWHAFLFLSFEEQRTA